MVVDDSRRDLHAIYVSDRFARVRVTDAGAVRVWDVGTGNCDTIGHREC